MHKILGNRFLERFSVGGPAWHKLGVVFDEKEQISASEAAKRVAGDQKVEARELYYRSLETGEFVRCDNYQAIVRNALKDDNQERIFGVTTEKWKHVPYPSLARALDELTKKYRLETCGLIEDGSLMFLVLRGPDFSVRGDEMKDYFIANFSNQPKNAHKILAAPVRVVCFNTNIIAQEKATISLNIGHTGDAVGRIRLAADLVARFKEMTQKTHDLFNLLAQETCTVDGLEQILAVAYPPPAMPAELRLLQNALDKTEEGALQKVMGDRWAGILQAQKTHENAIERVKALRQTAQERFEAFEPTRLRGTLWAAYNAVTEMADWREGKNADVSSVWGSRAKEKGAAFSKALELVNAN